MNWANEWCGKSCSSLHAAYSENLTAWLLQFTALLEMQKKLQRPRTLKFQLLDLIACSVRDG